MNDLLQLIQSETSPKRRRGRPKGSKNKPPRPTITPSSSPVTALRPVQVFFPDRPLRWIADACRAGKIPGAVKYGKVWMVSESDLRGVPTPKKEPPRPPTLEEAMADLRRRGVR